MKQKIGELFSGPGGIAIGAKLSQSKNVEVEHVWANDYCSATCETYKHNVDISPKMVFCEPVQDFWEKFSKLPKITGLCFGFPCNDFSNIGEKKGTAGAGYTITPHLYKFEEYGVPQARHRINFHPTKGVQIILTGIPALRYAYETQEAATTAGELAGLPYAIHEGDTKIELECPQMLLVEKAKIAPEPLQPGDKVRILPQFQDPGDDDYERVLLEARPDCTRVLIQTLIPGLIFQPTERLERHMLEALPKLRNKPLRDSPPEIGMG